MQSRLNLLKEAKSKDEWQKTDDELLMKLCNEYKNWNTISTKIGNKSRQQCIYRYQKLLKNSKGTSTKWKRIEDLKLIEMVEKVGKNWELISKYMPERTVEEIRFRYEDKLNNNVKKNKFTKEEDDLIINLHAKFGQNWDEIAKHIPKRTSIMIKSRFYLLKKLKYRVSDFSNSQNNEASECNNLLSLRDDTTSGLSLSKLELKSSSTVDAYLNPSGVKEQGFLIGEHEVSTSHEKSCIDNSNNLNIFNLNPTIRSNTHQNFENIHGIFDNKLTDEKPIDDYHKDNIFTNIEILNGGNSPYSNVFCFTKSDNESHLSVLPNTPKKSFSLANSLETKILEFNDNNKPKTNNLQQEKKNMTETIHKSSKPDNKSIKPKFKIIVEKDKKKKELLESNKKTDFEIKKQQSELSNIQSKGESSITINTNQGNNQPVFIDSEKVTRNNSNKEDDQILFEDKLRKYSDASQHFQKEYNNIFRMSSDKSSNCDYKDEDVFDEFFSKNPQSSCANSILNGALNYNSVINSEGQQSIESAFLNNKSNTTSDVDKNKIYLNLQNPNDMALIEKFNSIKKIFLQINDSSCYNLPIEYLNLDKSNKKDGKVQMTTQHKEFETKILSLFKKLLEVQSKSTIGTQIIKEALIEQIEIFIDLIKLRKQQIELIHSSVL